MKHYVFVCTLVVSLLAAVMIGFVPLADAHSLENSMEALEMAHNGKVAVFAINLQNGKEAAYRADERMAYCSTFKVLLAAEVMKGKSLAEMDEVIRYTDDDLVRFSPITEKNTSNGMTVRELCEAALRVSDNTAANLLLKEIGGPDALRQRLREAGDEVSLPEMDEPMLNVVHSGEVHDTSTARQMVMNYRKYLLTDDILPCEKRNIVLEYMKGNAATAKLRAAVVPANCIVADKSGSGPYGIRNDVGIIYDNEDDKAPVIVGIFTSHEDIDSPADNALVAEAARLAYENVN